MEYRRLGKTGLQISVMGLGSWLTFGNKLTDKEAQNCMAQAFEHGINFYDNAEVYENGQAEIIMGDILKNLKWRRDSYILSSKVFWGGDRPTQLGLSRKHVTDAINNSLLRLKTDYLDLYYCHRPDQDTEISETVEIMSDLIRQGKIVYWGTSEWAGEQILEATIYAKANGLVPPSIEQSQYNMFHRQKVENEFQILYDGIGLGLTTYSPLASGLLTPRYLDGIPSDSRVNDKGLEWLKESMLTEDGLNRFKLVKALNQVALNNDTSLPKLAIAWCIRNTNVGSVLLGASKQSQLEENLKAFELYQSLPEQVWQEVNQILTNSRMSRIIVPAFEN